ncbi:uncharacterized protein M6B38_149980 [Iris pallida]|uniref:Uncharacterized protein n=1 Tax=Iris pallida TaxID=29817 RepID=A0AAX6F845_IRIPA|nr:uncharacterized protein M6B38_149980 [Iris pallida]
MNRTTFAFSVVTMLEAYRLSLVNSAEYSSTYALFCFKCRNLLSSSNLALGEKNLFSNSSLNFSHDTISSDSFGCKELHQISATSFS